MDNEEEENVQTMNFDLGPKSPLNERFIPRYDHLPVLDNSDMVDILSASGIWFIDIKDKGKDINRDDLFKKYAAEKKKELGQQILNMEAIDMSIVTGSLERIDRHLGQTTINKTHIDRMRNTMKTLLECMDPDGTLAKNKELAIRCQLRQIDIYSNKDTITDVKIAFAELATLQGADFYNQLFLSKGMFDINIPMVFRNFLHTMNQKIISEDYLQVLGSRASGNSGGRIVQTLIRLGDYACFPMTDELVECIIKVFLCIFTLDYNGEDQEAIKLQNENMLGIPSRVSLMALPFGGSDPIAEMKNSTVLSYISIWPSDIESAVLKSRMVDMGRYHEWYYRNFPKNDTSIHPSQRADIARPDSDIGKEHIMTAYRTVDVHVRRNKAGFVRRVKMLISLTLGHKEYPNKAYAFVVNAVSSYVEKFIKPVLLAFTSLQFGNVSSTTRRSTNERWFAFSLDFDYIDTLKMLADINRPAMSGVSSEMHAKITHAVTTDIINVINTNRALIGSRKSWTFMRNQEEENAFLNNKDGSVIDRIMRDDLGFGAKYVKFKQIVTKSNNTSIFVEPTVDWWSIGDEDAILTLIDPDFHVMYCIYRLLIKAKTRDDLKLIKNVYITPIIEEMRINRMHATLTMPDPRLIEREIVETMKTSLWLYYNQPTNAAVDSERKTISTALPRFKAEHRRYLISRLINELESVHHNGRMIEVLVALVNGVAFNTCNFVHANAVSVDELSLNVRSEGSLRCMRNLHHIDMISKCVSLSKCTPVGMGNNTVRVERNEDATYKLTFAVDMLLFDSNVVMNAVWLWIPYRNSGAGSKMIVIGDNYKKLRTLVKKQVLYTLHIPCGDGFEGVYTFVVGNKRTGYMRRSINFHIMSRCVRTQTRYEEKDNAYGKAFWDGYAGWYSHTTRDPYISKTVGGFKKQNWGDAMVAYFEFYKLFFCVHENLDLAPKFLDFMADAVNTRTTVDVKTRPELIYYLKNHTFPRRANNGLVDTRVDAEIVKLIQPSVEEEKEEKKKDDDEKKQKDAPNVDVENIQPFSSTNIQESITQKLNRIDKEIIPIMERKGNKTEDDLKLLLNYFIEVKKIEKILETEKNSSEDAKFEAVRIRMTIEGALNNNE